jgi:hypothetical protein
MPEPDEDQPTGWIEYADGTWAAVGEDGMPGEPVRLGVSDLSESDAPVALVAAVAYIDPLDAHDHSNGELVEIFERMCAAGWIVREPPSTS